MGRARVKVTTVLTSAGEGGILYKGPMPSEKNAARQTDFSVLYNLGYIPPSYTEILYYVFCQTFAVPEVSLNVPV